MSQSNPPNTPAPKSARPAKSGGSINLLEVAFTLGYTIVIPLLAGLFLGLWLDRKFDSAPILLLSCMLVSIIVSSLALVVKFSRYLKDIE